ncbi:molybdopterin-guanine dinucleotide biosynthesis protein A [Halovivax asiaticus JCM 14624]|uniref:Molybdopterin-guanine dinucleotide biosynthesis protein A n=1 Tax=Halovivax asiaticus JCM 14624 TaxID=1227490 RepID=M0BIH0_9EURY|nr:molybdenum cofactor guanylyltransferase [Halovivax asiaticus]ELZ10083.1 molybdopterin-guanine dinucleotide biosynthesis protein A [Halovivax asiaticus JCM 14624]
MTTGIILAGGRSRRFESRDKLTATIAGRPMIAHVAAALDPVVDGLVVSCRADQVLALEDALGRKSQSIAFVPDRVPDRGPLGGFAAATEATASRNVAVVAGDMPLVTPSVVEALLSNHARECTVPVSIEGAVQPLCAVYRRRPAGDAARAALDAGERAVATLLDRLSVETVDGIAAQNRPGPFFDVDTPADRQRVASLLAGGVA